MKGGTDDHCIDNAVASAFDLSSAARGACHDRGAVPGPPASAAGFVWQSDLLALVADITQQRKERGLSQQALGELIDKSERTIRRMEAGEISPLTIPAGTLFEAAAAVGLRVYSPNRETER
jgi:DNA-binding XRE family transcriptional regulator